MIWIELNIIWDRYFSLTQIKGITTKFKHTIQYSNLSLAVRPVPQSAELPVPRPPKQPESQNSALVRNLFPVNRVRYLTKVTQVMNRQLQRTSFINTKRFRWFSTWFESIKKTGWTFRVLNNKIKWLEFTFFWYKNNLFSTSWQWNKTLLKICGEFKVIAVLLGLQLE